MTRALFPALSKRGNESEVPFYNSIVGNFMSYQDPIETNLLQLFAHSEYKRMVVYNFCFCYYF